MSFTPWAGSKKEDRAEGHFRGEKSAPTTAHHAHHTTHHTNPIPPPHIPIPPHFHQSNHF